MKKFAFVFPGQGSQSVGMLADIKDEFREVGEVFSSASNVLGYDLWDLVKNGPAEKLSQTEHTQPALLAASFAIWKVLTENSAIKPTVLAGHSLGEYTALVCAEALRFEDAIDLVAARGKFMQEAVPVGEGALAAIIGLDNAAVIELCNTAKLENEVLQAANFNSKGQVVIAGNKNSVDNAIKLSKEAGARLAKLLPVSVPSHCDLMKPAALKLKLKLQDIAISKPKLPVINNVDVKVYDSSDAIKDGLIRQLSMPVRFVEAVDSFSNFDIDNVIECGPGKVLTGLIKRINSNIELNNTADIKSLQKLIDYAKSE